MFRFAGAVFFGFIISAFANANPTFGLWALGFSILGLMWESSKLIGAFAGFVAVVAAIHLMFTPALVAGAIFLTFAVWGIKD